jgi:phosphoribosylformimino-5-aminoimidazole carboxamide ribotide isomerase
MIAIPAIEIRDGACQQLGGSSGSSSGSSSGDSSGVIAGDSVAAVEAVSDDPLGIAYRWDYAGFQRVHLADSDADACRGSNTELICAVIRATNMKAQVSAGVRDQDGIEALLRNGANRIVIGIPAIESPDWLREMAETFPGTLIVAADVRERHVATHRWSRSSDRYVLDLIDDLNVLPLAGFMLSAIHKQGPREGTDLSIMEEAVEESQHPVCANCNANYSIEAIGDLRALEDRGVSSVVIGAAFYNGVLDPSAVAEEFAE